MSTHSIQADPVEFRRVSNRPDGGTPHENAASQQPCRCMIVPQDLSGDDSRDRGSYDTPQVSLVGPSSTGWPNDGPAPW